MRWLPALLLVSLSANAERLYVCGFELPTTRAGIEIDPGVGTDGGILIDATGTAQPHGGTCVARAFSIPGQRSSYRAFFLTSTAAMYARVYARLDRPVSAETMFLLVRRSSASPAIAWLTIDAANTVRANVWVSAWPGSVTLTPGVWHRFDIFVDERSPSGQHVVQIALDGNTFVLAQNQSLTHIVDEIDVGLNVNADADSTGAMSFDDLAVNGTAGTSESGFPPPGRLWALHPNAQAGTAQWTRADGGAAGVDNWVYVADPVPDDDVTALTSLTNQNAADEYDVDPPPSEAASSAVSLVAVGARFKGSSTMPSSLAVTVRATSTGTQQVSAAVATDVLSWMTNRADGYTNYPLAVSTTPEGAAWSSATLDTLRIGLRDADSVARPITVSSVYAYVELGAPLEPPPPTPGVASDAGTPDAGAADAGAPDAGAPDAGAPDAGAPDAGAPDAGSPDAGTAHADAGTPPELRQPLAVGCGCSQLGSVASVFGAVFFLRRRRRWAHR